MAWFVLDFQAYFSGLEIDPNKAGGDPPRDLGLRRLEWVLSRKNKDRNITKIYNELFFSENLMMLYYIFYKTY